MAKQRHSRVLGAVDLRVDTHESAYCWPPVVCTSAKLVDCVVHERRRGVRGGRATGRRGGVALALDRQVSTGCVMLPRRTRRQRPPSKPPPRGSSPGSSEALAVASLGWVIANC